jgi:hypothetical protein
MPHAVDDADPANLSLPVTDPPRFRRALLAAVKDRKIAA